MKTTSKNHVSHQTRIAVIGTGMVGSSFAYAAMIKGLAAELIMIDANDARAEGEVMDLSHGLIGTSTGRIRKGNFKDCGNVDVVVITAGLAQKPGETRLDLLKKNAAILQSIVRQMGPLREDTVVIVVSNPVDLMAHLAAQLIKLPKGQVFGSGISLDTARLHFNVSDALGVNLHNVHGYVLGEHGDSEFVSWSTAYVSGVKASDLLTPAQRKTIEEKTMRAAYEIIQRKQATYYGIGVVVAELCEHVLHDRKFIAPVSTEPGAAYGIHGISVGVPAVLGRHGVEKVWKLPLSAPEMAKLKKSAEILKGYWRKI